MGGAASADIVWLSVQNSGNDPSAVNKDSLTINEDGTYDVPFNNTAVYSPVAYAPQLFAFQICNLINTSAEVKFYAAEIVSLTIFVFIAMMSVGLMPCCKFGILGCFLFPLTWYPYSFAISADTFSFALVFLFCSLFYRVFKREASSLDYVILCIIGFLMSTSKFSNSPIFFLVLCLPFEREKFSVMVSLYFCFCMAIVFDVAWIRVATASFTTSPSIVSYEIVAERNKNLLVNMHTFLNHYLYSIFHFEGAYRFGREGAFCFWTVLLVAFITSIVTLFRRTFKARSVKLKDFSTLYFCIVVLAFAFVTYFALWLQYTPDNSIGIDGIQYRYFLPTVPVFLLIYAELFGSGESDPIITWGRSQLR